MTTERPRRYTVVTLPPTDPGYEHGLHYADYDTQEQRIKTRWNTLDEAIRSAAWRNNEAWRKRT